MSPTFTRIAVALAGALFAACATGAPPPAPGSTSSAPGTRPHAAKDSPMQSGAMHDAMGVAMQALRFAAQHPEASEADKQAKANDIMSRLFQRELNEGAPEERSHTQQQAAPGGDGG